VLFLLQPVNDDRIGLWSKSSKARRAYSEYRLSHQPLLAHVIVRGRHATEGDRILEQCSGAIMHPNHTGMHMREIAARSATEGTP
jgi:hypothetical protein